MLVWPWTKFVVPSMGSTIKVGAGVRRPVVEVSSPRKLEGRMLALDLEC